MEKITSNYNSKTAIAIAIAAAMRINPTLL